MKKVILFAAAVAAFAVSSCCNCGELSLAGKWNVETVAGEEITGLEQTPYIEFAAEADENGAMRVHGYTGVNIVNSTYEADGKSLKFGMGATTMMAGPENAMKVEKSFLKAFGEVASAKLDKEGVLSLSDADGNVVMTLTKE